MDNRERATQFVASLPKFEGIQRISPTDPERYKVYKDLIDKLEKEFNNVSLHPWQIEVTENLKNKGRTLRTLIEPAGLGKGKG